MRGPRRETYRPAEPPQQQRGERRAAEGGRRRRTLWATLPAAGVGVLAVTLIVTAVHQRDGAEVQPFSGEPVVAIVGDASARALVTGGGDRTDAVGAGLGARIVTRVDTAARYSAPPASTGSTRRSAGPASAVQVSALAQQIPAASKVVVLAAGQEDDRASEEQLRQGVARSVRAVENAAPRSRLVLLAPVRASDRVRRALRMVAALEHLVYIDPTVCGWLASAGDLSPDGRSLSAKGRADLAAGLRAVLARLASAPGQQGSAPPSGASPTGPSSTTTSAPSSAARPTSSPSLSASAASTASPSSAPIASPTAAASSPITAALPRLPAGSTAYFFGDSWVHGESATNLKGFPFITASHFGWSPVVDGRSGSGYIHSTVASSPLFPARAAAVPSSIDPDVVIVEGGLNDRMSDLATLQSAAQLTWSRLESRFPKAPLVVVGPASPTLPVSPQLQQVDRILQQAAADEGLVYISALQEHWFTASDVGRYIDAGTLHPNDAGHAYYAKRLEADLVAQMNG